MTDRITLADWERAAASAFDPVAWGYVRSGADDERTLRDNTAAFDRWRLLPRVFVDVGAIDLSTTLLGRRRPTPIHVAPTAYHGLAHPDAEVATARGALAAGAVLTVSTLSNRALEEIAAVGGPRWFQLYVHRDRGITRALVERAEAAGYEALVVTADAPVLGRRLADERHRFTLPPHLGMANLAGYADDGGDTLGLRSSLADLVARRHDPTLTWRDLEALCRDSRVPVLCKGILRPDDAQRAFNAGCKGIVVSNHGGRQLDGAPATIDVLAEIVDAVGWRGDVIVDGGFRRGTDVLTALAMGARAVLVGRPVLWGLAVGGADGVAAVLATLTEELTRAMALVGASSLAALDRGLVRRVT